MLILAFDTATDVATVALTRDDDVLGERVSQAAHLLRDAGKLLEENGLDAGDIDAIAVGTGPGRYTSLRMGLVTARALSLSLDVPVAGVSTLATLAAGASGAKPVIDARRGEVFVVEDGEDCVRGPHEVRVEAGTRLVGDGAVRYRDVLEEGGAEIPDDSSELHVPWARHHASLAADFGGAELAAPIYLRLPDAEKALRR